MDASWLFEPARMQFCEQTLDGLIKHPADTWTNIGPIIAGVMILVYATRPLERLLGAASLWTGVASGYFHASNTILGETLDLSGMFMFILTLAALQQQRSREWLSSGLMIPAVVLGTLALTFISTMNSILASPLFGALVVLVCIHGGMEKRIGKYAWWMVGTFGVAWTFWWLDILRILCWPGNHILTGHGVWHLLNGLVFWFAFMHFRYQKTRIVA